MRASVIGLVLGAILRATSAAAYDAYDPANCSGADWDAEHALIVSKVAASPRVNFVKSPMTIISRPRAARRPRRPAGRNPTS